LKRALRNCVGVLILGAAACASIGSTGCATHVTYYDEYHHDYHRWDHHEVVLYRSYWEGRHQPYREYSSLNKDEQRDYWNWRHEQH
jgi:hypothetical protein